MRHLMLCRARLSSLPVLEKLKHQEEEPQTMTRGASAELPTGYRTIDYTYESIDEQGRPVTLSARVVWGVLLGVREFSPKYMLLSPHLTITDDFSCPTSGACFENLMLKGDKLLILPDYLGYGVTKDRVHSTGLSS